MIELNLFTEENQGDAIIELFDTKAELLSYLLIDVYKYHTDTSVWILANDRGESCDIFISRDFTMLCEVIQKDLLMPSDIDLAEDIEFSIHLQKYLTWEEAYKAAFYMREPEENCYNSSLAEKN